MLKKKDFVKNTILSEIQQGMVQVGEKIESENQLAQRFKTSRMTIRKALDELEAEKILTRIQGKGTFLRVKPKYMEFQCGVGFSEEVRKRGMTPSTCQAALHKILAKEAEEVEFQLSADTPLWQLQRVRCADGLIVALEEEYLLADMISPLEEKDLYGSIYELLEKRDQIFFQYADQTLDAIAAEPRVAELLRVPTGTPLLRMKIVAYEKKGSVFNWGTTYFRTDHFHLIQTVFKR